MRRTWHPMRQPGASFALALGVALSVMVAIPVPPAQAQGAGSLVIGGGGQSNVVIDLRALDTLGQDPFVTRLWRRELPFDDGGDRVVRLRPPPGVKVLGAEPGLGARQGRSRIVTLRPPRGVRALAPARRPVAARAAPPGVAKPPTGAEKPPPRVEKPPMTKPAPAPKAPMAPVEVARRPLAPPPPPPPPTTRPAPPPPPPVVAPRRPAVTPPKPPAPEAATRRAPRIIKAPPPPPPPRQTKAAPKPAPRKAPVRLAARTPPKATPKVALPRTIGFAKGSAELSEKSRGPLKALADRMLASEGAYLQIRAYAYGTPETSSAARRLSLSRALAVRSALIDKGVRGIRIDVRAMGMKSGKGPPDRVDLILRNR